MVRVFEKIGLFIVDSFTFCWTAVEILFFLCLCLFLSAFQMFAENCLPKELGLRTSVWVNRKLDKL